MTFDTYEVALTVAGLVVLATAWLPAYLTKRPLSLPLVLVGLGALVFALPLGLFDPDPRSDLEFAERLTELGVIVALMGAGLKLDRPVGWRRWRTTWRMLGVAMPLTIAAIALSGWWWLGLVPASAILLGAVLAPTDPVLASEVQVGEPGLEEGARADEDDVRFTLTSEGGLNDALAFPFVYLAIVVSGGWGAGSLGEWLAVDVGYRIVVGLALGVAVGWLLGVISFRPPGPLRALAESSQGFVAVAATLLAYGVAELAQGYGFLAVFVAAVTLRASERHHEYHRVLHDFTEDAGNLLVVGLLVVFGGAVASGLLIDDLTWAGAAVAVVAVLVVRPAAGWIALLGTSVPRGDRWAIAFFGIRGIGSIYYLAYATSAERFSGVDTLWSVVTCTILLSLVVHGVTAAPTMAWLDGIRRRRWRLLHRRRA